MLRLTYSPGAGKSYQGELVDADVLLKLFPVQEIPTAKAPKVRFSNGATNRTGLGVATTFTAKFNGRDVKLEYFSHENETQTPKGNVIKEKVPARINLGHGTPFQKSKEYEQFVFLLLTPQNENSPLKGLNNRKNFRFDLPEKQAKQEWGAKKLVLEILNKMDEEPIETLRIRAKGIEVAKQKIYGVDELSDDEVKMEMSKLAERDPAAFNQAWSSVSTTLGGMVQNCLDSGLIVVLPAGGTTLMASWRGCNGDGQITTFERGGESVLALKAYFMRDLNRSLELLSEASMAKMVVSKEVTDAMEKIMTNSGRASAHMMKVNKVNPSLLTPLELSRLAFDEEWIAWDDTKKAFVQQDKDGNFGDIVYTPTNAAPKQRRVNFENFVEKNAEMASRLLDYVETRLGNKKA